MIKDWARMGEKARILIVDDDESTCRSMKIIFDKKGYETDTVFSGKAAKDKAQSTFYDLIFLDIILPDFDGIDLMTYLDEMCPGTAFVMITGQASVRTAVRALNRGASDYVVKPFDMDEVLSAVSRALESRHMTRVKERILIVDDDESICRTMKLIFEAKNYDTEIVNSGQEAIAATKKRPYNLAILDIRLPDVDGITLLEQLSKMNADIGIIMITGYASIETAVEALNKGAAAYITKPLNMDEVLITVNKALEKQRLTRAKLRAEAALQEERDRAQKYLDIAGVAFIVLNENGLVSLINTKGCEILGREDYEVLGQNWFDIAVPEELLGEAMNIFNSLTSGAVDEVEYYEGDILTKNNERKTIAWHYVALTDRSGKVIGTLCSGEDITERKRAEGALREERNKAQMYMDIAGVMIVTLDSDGTVTLVNRRSCEILGYDSKEIIGKDWFKTFIPKSLRKEVYRAFTSLMKGDLEPVEYYENPILTKDGEERIIAWNNTLLTDEAGNITGTLSSGEDVTERKQAEEALRESESRFRTIFEQAPMGVARVGLDGIILQGNSSLALMLGYDTDELVGINAFDISTPEDEKIERRLSQELLQGIRDSYEMEKRFIRKDGEEIWGILSVSVVSNLRGEPTFTIGMVENITERKKAEKALEERVREITCLLGTSQLASKSELAVDAFLKGVVKLLPPAWFHAEITCARILLDGLVFTTSNFKETKWKQVADINIGRERRGAVEVYHLEQRPELDEDPFLKEERVLIDGVAEQIGNAIGRWQAEEELRELTEELEQRVKKRTQELAASNQELESFAYSVSHDLRSPLRGIAGFSMAVLEDYSNLLDETGRDYLRRMHDATVRMSELIDDVLSLSRVSRGEMHSEEIDMTAFARTIAGELRSQEPGRKAKLVISDNLEAYGDKRLMYLVLENLLGNAWKFTSKQRSARIEFGATEQENETVFCVRDNGVGFDMKYVDKMFDVFQRLHHADEFEGTGIGLAIVKRIISRHGGRTWAEGTVGKGATFYFTLPSKGSEVLT